MRSFIELLDSPSDLEYLSLEGVFVSQRSFVSQLVPPRKPELANQLESKEAPLVCSGQQIYVDYRQSVLSKIEILRELANEEPIFPFFLWLDTDRTGSDNLMTKFAWPKPSKKGPITILPPGTREVEARFAQINPAVVMQAVDRLGTHLRQSNDAVKGAKERYEAVRSIFVEGSKDTLSEFNLRLTTFLLSQVLNYAPRSVVLSHCLGQETFLSAVNQFVNQLDAVISTFNAAVEELRHKGINPQVNPLPENYLPLFYSCHLDGFRLRLSRVSEGQDHFAKGRCKCGAEYKFHLGRQTLAIDEIASTGRWSPDICFPIFFNDLVSGYVAGKSSALYLLVMNKVQRNALGKSPVPVLAPVNVELQARSGIRHDSLMFRYLAGV